MDEMHLQDSKSVNKTKKKIRVWVDGCFDLGHFGHANLLRQAKQLGDQLIVGIHSDAEITKHKGPPVFNEHERYKLIEAMIWVDEVVKDAPYFTYVETLEKYSCDFCVHGDDLVVSNDGTDPYKEVKLAGKYRQVSRTEGISTTALVSRMLKRIHEGDEKSSDSFHKDAICTRSNLRHIRSLDTVLAPPTINNRTSNLSSKQIDIARHKLNSSDQTDYSVEDLQPQDLELSIWSTGGMSYLPNILRISQFCAGRFHEPTEQDTVVYVPGTFDLFHIGHLSFIEACLKLGNYVLIGLNSDKTASKECGQMGTILNLHERLLSVIACRHVQNVIIDPPYVIPASLLDHFKVRYVAIGWDKDLSLSPEGLDPMMICKQRGIVRRIDSKSVVTTAKVISRIMRNRLLYTERNKKKESKELNLIQTNNHFLPQQ